MDQCKKHSAAWSSWVSLKRLISWGLSQTGPSFCWDYFLIISYDAKIKSTCLLKDLLISFYIITHFNDEGTIPQLEIYYK